MFRSLWSLGQVLLTLLAASVLTACTSMPLGTMVKLVRMDMAEMNPAEVRAAVRAHHSIGLDEGSAQLSLSFKTDDDVLVVDDVYELEISSELNTNLVPAESAQLNNGRGEDEDVTLLNLSESDAARVQAAMAQIRAYRRDGGKGEGSLSFSLNRVCMKAARPEGKLPVDAFVRFNPATGYLMFQENLDAYRLGKESEQILKAMQPCAGLS